MTPATDPEFLTTDHDITCKEMSVCNTDAGTTVFSLYKTDGVTSVKMMPDISLDGPAVVDGRGTFVYRDFFLAAGFTICVKIISGAADVDLSYTDLIQP